MADRTRTDITSRKLHGATNPLGKRLYTLKEAAQYLGRSDWGMRDMLWMNYRTIRWSRCLMQKK